VPGIEIKMTEDKEKPKGEGGWGIIMLITLAGLILAFGALTANGDRDDGYRDERRERVPIDYYG